MIGGQTVWTPDGAVWRVGRRLTPWRPVWVDGMWHGLIKLARFPLPDDPNLAPVHRQAIRGKAMGIWLNFTMIAALFEGAAMLAATPFYLPAYVVGRTLGHKPWTVDAHRVGSRRHHVWEVQGWSASRCVIDEVVADLRHQRTPNPNIAKRTGHLH